MTGCVCLEVAIGPLAATQLEQNAEFVSLAAPYGSQVDVCLTV